LRKKRDRVTFKSRDSESDDSITGTATVNYLGTAKMIRIGVDIQNQRVNAITLESRVYDVNVVVNMR
jgi:hypothetical protein